MKAIVAVLTLLIAVLAPLAPVHAQDPFAFSRSPGLLPPPPPAPPPPSMEVPKIPQMDAAPQPRAAPQRKSFDARVQGCIDEGSAMGLGPNERSAYTGACANR